MTWPTRLSCLRILLTFLIMRLLFVPGPLAKSVALCGFLLAASTDWLDGYLARRWSQTSALGALIDPIADKVLVLGLFLAFVQLGLIPAWMVLVIALREFLITGVRLFAASRQVVLPATREGKHKTISQMVAILAVLTVLTMQEWLGRNGLSHAAVELMRWAILGSLWTALILTVISGTSFFWRYRDLLKDAVSR